MRDPFAERCAPRRDPDITGKAEAADDPGSGIILVKMKKVFVCLLLCLLFILLLGVRGGPGAGVTRCLLIGCDRFVTLMGTEPASANNVDTMEALLTDFLPAGTKIRRQVNGPGTVEGFERLVEDAFREANEEDIALIYLSTHGMLNDVQGQQRVYMVLSDGEEEDRLGPGRLRRIMNKVPGKKVLILDACHSGAMIGCGGAGYNWFDDENFRVLVSGGALENSWFWNTGTDEYTGTGYFTSAMDSALRASDPEQIDQDGSGEVSLKELTARLREIHGASTVYCWPEESEDGLFRIPADRKPGSRLQAVTFGQAVAGEDKVEVPVHFRVPEQMRVMYQMVPSQDGSWDFGHMRKEMDRGRSGLIRGLLNPGEINRHIRIPFSNFGEDGRVLLQVVTLQGDGLTPVAEAGRVITLDDQ